MNTKHPGIIETVKDKVVAAIKEAQARALAAADGFAIIPAGIFIRVASPL